MTTQSQATFQALTDDQLKALNGGTSLSYTSKLPTISIQKANQE